jgi:hypothetical protein
MLFQLEIQRILDGQMAAMQTMHYALKLRKERMELEKPFATDKIYQPEHVVLAVDFDGTVCTVDYPEIGRERMGAKETINKLYDEGYMIIINTCRTDAGVHKAATMAQDFLKLRGIKYHHFNVNAPHILELYGCDTRKISADVYIDDKCLFEIPSWEHKYDIIKKKYPNPFDKNDKKESFLLE